MIPGRLRQDSRLVSPGDVFVALDGVVPAKGDWVADALARGAAEVWVDVALADVPDDPRVIAFSPLVDVVGQLASDWYGRPSEQVTVFGVTGTNGKTSTVQLLAQAWEMLGLRAATIGTLGAAMHGDDLTLNGYTTPPVTRLHELLAEFRERGATRIALEVSSHALEERRADGVAFDAVHYANLTRDHLDYHGSMEHYAAQKAKIYGLAGKFAGKLAGKSAAPLAIGNLDDGHVREAWGALPEDRERVGLSSLGAPNATIRAERLRFEIAGTTFDLVDDGADGGTVTVTSPLIGRFNVDNLLAVVAVLRRVDGLPLEDIAAIVPALRAPNGRMWRIRPDDSLPTVIVDAGHTPDAMRQAVTALGEYGFARIITVFGATGDRDPGKRPEMAQAVEDGSDVVIVTDDDVHDEDGDAIVAQLLEAMRAPEAATVIRDRTSAVEHAIRLAGPDDVVLLAGKGHEPMQIVANHVEIPYSDIETAERVLARILAERG
ncbi:MAG TPA: UDP-N-acetylmuramoyl-L-alanyl-D-glutamate--2,6-diaminopimelate ligase [Microbacteriaceae bacterium]|nr:UDP-N-acetylmuramoyl-L-alanyl-D-glutamate--2,6-diaminopimelate ligase [Microbacteriaceae bacterium]